MSIEPDLHIPREQLDWAYRLHKCETDFLYLSSQYLRVKSKATIGFPTLSLNPVQRYLYGRMHDQLQRKGYIRQIWGKCRQVGACFDPDTPVLTADLHWLPIGKVAVGERLISVDEFPPTVGRGHGRKFRTAVVEAVNEVYEPAFELRMSNGQILIATGDHRLLVRKGFGEKHSGSRWQAVNLLNRTYAGVAGKHRIRYAIRPWADTHDFEDGWMGGILDGEGCFRWKRSGVEMNITQVDGPVWERILAYLRRHDYTAHLYVDDRVPGPRSKLGGKKLNRVHVFHMNEVMRLLATTRPVRWSTVGDWWDGKALSGCGYNDEQSWPVVEDIIPLGPRRMIDLQTSTKTYIANGFVSHNSTLARAVSFHQTAFKDNRNALLVAHDEPSSYELFDMDQTFYDALPPQLKPSLKYRQKSKMQFENRRSKLLVGHALNLNVGASQMNHIVHLTEVARYPHPEDIQASLFPSISDAKGDDYSVVIIESTSRFGGDWFKAFAEAAMRGENEYEFTFVPWYWHPDYTLRGNHKQLTLTPEERELATKYKLTAGQIAWRRQKQSEYITNPSMFFAEYAIDWESSWVLPEGTARVFADADLQPLEHFVRPGKRHYVDSTGLHDTLGGPIEVWEPPIDGKYYDIGIDIAGGRTASADWTVLCVLRRDTLEQVAEVRIHMDPASAEFLDLVYWLGMTYNTACLCPDITGGWGHALLSDLQRRDYPNLWQWRRRDDGKERISARVGFYYTHREKAYLVHNAVAMVKRESPHLHSQHLWSEALHFLQIGLDEWGAAPGYHDDCVNAWMLALMAASDERAHGGDLQPPEPVRLPADTIHNIHDIDVDLTPQTMGAGTWLDDQLKRS